MGQEQSEEVFDYDYEQQIGLLDSRYTDVREQALLRNEVSIFII
jgi:hypothetical protein